LKKWVALVLVSLVMSSCGKPWPKEGSGGYAQTHNVSHEQILALEDRLNLYETCEAKTYAAIEYNDAEILLTYLKRSHFARDYAFAEREFVNLEILLTKIYNRLPYGRCRSATVRSRNER
jgi:hypothetical protein